MNRIIDYSHVFKQALSYIKEIRDPRSTRADTKDLRWREVEKQVVFDFENNDFKKYQNTAEKAKEISISCLCAIISYLMKEKYTSIHKLDIDDFQKELKPRLCLFVEQTNELLLFNEIARCPFWKSKDSEPSEVQSLMNRCGARSCKYIYFVYENAYLQIIGHNDDQDDPGRGYNAYSLKWFFEKYFSQEEWTYFEKELRLYTSNVNILLGYTVVKLLTPAVLVNFRKVTEFEIIRFDYSNIMSVSFNTCSLQLSDFNKVNDQFTGTKLYLSLLGQNDYAESIATAEWLYDSMRKAQAVDLTIIAMGYLKAVEQLLFDLICLHKNEGRQIKSLNQKRGSPAKVELNDVNISNDTVDTTIGSMAYFCRDNMDMFRADLSTKTKEYIKETIFAYKDIRNKYFHKNNIHSWNVVETIRNDSFNMLFLLLGGFSITKQDMEKIGYPAEPYTEYYKLCEYVNYHHGEIFYLDFGFGKERLVWGHCDMYAEIVNNRYVEYSGVYFKDVSENDRVFKLSQDRMPNKICLGKLVYGYTDKIVVYPQRIKTIYENGMFIGPSIGEEERIDY